MADDNEQPGLRQLWLEGIEVNLTSGRPNKKLELVVGIGETVFKHPLGKKEQVRWEGHRLCSKELMLTVEVQRPRFILFRLFRKPVQLAHFEVPLSTVDKSTITLSDASRGAGVKLSFAGVEDKDKKNDTARIRENVKEAKEKTDEKQRDNILNKIASARDLINSIGDHVKDLHPALAVFNAALQRFTDACAKRQEAWKAAGNLMEEFEMLLSITERVDVLKERRESREALNSMLQLIAEITDYICNHGETVIDMTHLQIS
ncbi:hypothetical protein BDN72DRAFT_477357 [Pluteus cervinus]|uniref:Uncharacterized protein n=1 Tax=Pluteus cervinus TaxID=181527 RepID=A0ACD3A6X7_9AGAR|nr:hypothetical protein BDN72DRAFT_477357 [Pluteus cervinus]